MQLRICRPIWKREIGSDDHDDDVDDYRSRSLKRISAHRNSRNKCLIQLPHKYLLHSIFAVIGCGKSTTVKSSSPIQSQFSIDCSLLAIYPFYRQLDHFDWQPRTMYTLCHHHHCQKPSNSIGVNVGFDSNLNLKWSIVFELRRSNGISNLCAEIHNNFSFIGTDDWSASSGFISR